MNEQNGIMRDQIKQTATSLDLAERATKAAEKQAAIAGDAEESAKESASAASRAIEATVQASEAARRSADAADRANQIADKSRQGSLESDKLFEQRLKQELRPYLIIEQSEIIDTNPQTHVQVTVRATNVGATPAHNATMVVAIKADKPAFADWDVKPIGRKSQALAGPGNSLISVTAYQLGAKERAMIKSGKWVFWVWGTVRYKDDFGEEHETKFRYLDEGNRQPFVRTGLTYADSGNESN